MSQVEKTQMSDKLIEKMIWMKKDNVKRDYKLTLKDQYDIWYDNFRTELVAKDLIHVIEGEEVRNWSVSDKSKRNFAVRDIIINHICEEYHTKLLKIDDPKELLKRLKLFKSTETNYTSASLKQKLLNLRYNPKRETVYQF